MRVISIHRDGDQVWLNISGAPSLEGFSSREKDDHTWVIGESRKMFVPTWVYIDPDWVALHQKHESLGDNVFESYNHHEDVTIPPWVLELVRRYR